MAEPTSTISQDDEQWKDAPGFGGVYAVSNMGRVRREADDPRHVRINRAGAVMKPRPDSNGYCRVRLTPPGGKTRSYSVHGLVAAVFIGPKPVGHQVNHKDTNKANNRADNLEYVTDSENMRHAARAGVLGRAKLTCEQVREIRLLLLAGVPSTRIGPKFGVTANAVLLIKHGKAWGHFEHPAGQPVAASRPRSTWRKQ